MNGKLRFSNKLHICCYMWFINYIDSFQMQKYHFLSRGFFITVLLVETNYIFRSIFIFILTVIWHKRLSKVVIHKYIGIFTESTCKYLKLTSYLNSNIYKCHINYQRWYINASFDFKHKNCVHFKEKWKATITTVLSVEY